MKYLKIKFWEFVIYLLKKGYGADCSDIDDNYLLNGGCASCKARFLVYFIKEHIELIKEFE